MKPNIKVYLDEKEVAKQLALYVVDLADKAIKERGVFYITFSGGSVSTFLSEYLPTLNSKWEKWHVFFGDERYINHEDVESNYGYYAKNLLTKLPIKKIAKINYTLPLNEAAKDYECQIRDIFTDVEFPKFDLMVLGIGPDGHTCSIFPHSDIIDEKSAWVVPVRNSPKPPPERITLTLPVVNHARNVCIVACGAGKSSVIKDIITNPNSRNWPASFVILLDGNLVWIIDQSAAKLLDTI